MDIDAIKHQLLERKQALLQRAARIDKHTHRDEPVPADFAEQATELENLDVLFALGQEGRQSLARIENALSRIDSGEYTTCCRCGSTIPEERLRALPDTDTCVNCAA